MRRLFFGCLCAVAVFFALFVSSAGAVEIIESQEPAGVPETPAAGWQAGTCTKDPCSAETPELFFKQAAGHPPDAFTQIIVKHREVETKPGVFEPEPVGSAKTFLVELPAGISVNAQATPQCELVVTPTEEKFPVGGCPADTRLGTSAVSVLRGPVSLGSSPVFNIKPREGEPARFGFAILGVIPVFLNAGVSWQSDYHEYFTIHVPQLGLALFMNRLVPKRSSGWARGRRSNARPIRSSAKSNWKRRFCRPGP